MISPSNWEQIRALFHTALERAPDERAAFLRAQSSDDEILREVASLLAAHADADALLDVAAGRAVVAQQHMSLAPGSRIGPYEIQTPSGPVAWASSTRHGTIGCTATLPSRP